MNGRALSTMLFVIVALAAGCGGADRPSLVKVKGKVLLDGKPVDGAMLFFKRDPADPTYRRPSRATSDAQGEFSPETYAKGDGIPPGKYKVGVRKTEYADKLPENFNPENPAATPVKIRWLVPKPAADPETSGVVVEISSSGISPAEIKLESGGSPPVVESTAPSRNANEP